MKHELPKLAYSYDALEPYMDKETMELHHGKHHQAYTNKMNAILEKYPELTEIPEELMAKLDSLSMDEKDKKDFINHGGGYINHKLFFNILGPQKEVDEKLLEEIKENFGSVEEMKKQMSDAAATHFGSGWAWLVRNKDNKLEVYPTSNQDSPLLKGDTPIICIDVWEHAYYLKYQNRRPEYIENLWNIIKLV